MFKKKKYTALALTVGLVAFMGWYVWDLGGLPLTTLTPANFDQFRSSFDGSADEARLVVLLSPT